VRAKAQDQWKRLGTRQEEFEVLRDTIRQFFRAVMKEKLLEEALVFLRPPKVDSFGSRRLFSGSYRIFSAQFCVKWSIQNGYISPKELSMKL
jgi:hypothetical protein